MFVIEDVYIQLICSIIKKEIWQNPMYVCVGLKIETYINAHSQINLWKRSEDYKAAVS